MSRLDTGRKGDMISFIAPLVFMETEWQASGTLPESPSKTHIPGPTWFLVCLEVQRIGPSLGFSGELEDYTFKE